MASARKSSRSNGSLKKRGKARPEFAVCVKNPDYKASLELRKIYRVLSDHGAAAHGFVRIVDESGEDYLYPKDYFLTVSLPKPIQRALMLAS